MKNETKGPSLWSRLKRKVLWRWLAEDYPGAEPRFQLRLLGKDVGTYIFLPIAAILLFKACEYVEQKPKHSPPPQSKRDGSRFESNKSQIIEFKPEGSSSPLAHIQKKAPGTIVRLKLMNVVETYANAPVHAQVIDNGLGPVFLGGTLIGEGVPDTNFDRINITFRYALEPKSENLAVPIAARALSLDGTLGIIAEKKEGFFTRSALGSAAATSQSQQGTGSSVDLKDILLKALSAGLLQEIGSSSQTEKNRSQVLSIQPATEFLVELTDYFPAGGSK